MPLKVKELKDDAVVTITCTKALYIMLKNALLYIFNDKFSTSDPTEHLKSLMSNEYNNMSDPEKTFYTLLLMIAEAEQKAVEKNLFMDTVIPEPGDPDYEEPTLD